MTAERHAALAVQRFGLGARPGEVSAARQDPRGFLLAQLDRPGAGLIDEALPTSAEALRRFIALRDATQRSETAAIEARRLQAEMQAAGPLPGMEGRMEPFAPPREENARRQILQPELRAKFRRAFTTQEAFVERLVLFFVNHFAVSIRKGAPAVAMNGAFEREAIRPHVTGRFVDMLLAVERHPAMLYFLDNQRSTGPNSRAGRNQSRSLNENLAREILELHTLGVDAGYTQADVTALATVLTGWTFAAANQPDGGAFVFRPNMHEPGPKTVLGRTYARDGIEQGVAVLTDLANHPATARHLARKLAAHFVADAPPAALTARLEASLRTSGGDLKAVARALVTAQEAWDAPLTKLRTPFEFITAAMRAARAEPDPPQVVNWTNALGQPVMAPPSPKGFPDDAATWTAPDGMVARLSWATAMGNRFGPRLDALAVGQEVLGDLFADETKTALRRAESRQQAFTLLLMSPEFQRR